MMAQMRIVTWNCAMAFRKKVPHIAALEPDIAVIPECGNADKAALDGDDYSGLWFGSNPNKGLGVFARAPLRLKIVCDSEHRWVVPLDVEGARRPFRLVAVWACRVGTVKDLNYIGQIYKAFTRLRSWLSAQTVIAGDFNSNATFDHARPIANHTAVVNLLAKRRIVSAYHFFPRGSARSGRRSVLFIFRKDRHNPFHLDYVFIPRPWTRHLRQVRVGTHSKWLSMSDHRPLIVDVDL